MKTIVGEIDHAGLRRILPTDPDWAALPGPVGMRPAPESSAALVWALLADADAEEVRADVRAGRPGAACGLLLNRAVELLAIGPVPPRSGRRRA